MKLLVRAVVTGFGLSIGAALYKKVAKQLGLEDKSASKDKDDARPAGTSGEAGMSAAQPEPHVH